MSQTGIDVLQNYYVATIYLRKVLTTMNFCVDVQGTADHCEQWPEGRTPTKEYAQLYVRFEPRSFR